MSILDINYEHRQLSSKAPQFFATQAYKYKSYFCVHGVNLEFCTNNLKFNQELKSYFPKSWRTSSQPEFKIYWNQPTDILGSATTQWGELASADCHFINLHDKDWIIQRDFMAYHPDHKTSFVVANTTIDDGFYNFLRYFLPLKLFKQNKILFHSSCVVDDNTSKAQLFFGHSGAGKTTISQLCKQGRVLGDDMNLLTIQDGQVWVEPSAMGQLYFNPENFDLKFPVEQAFWLKKSNHNQATPLTHGVANKIFSSFTGLFWKQLSEKELDLCFTLMQQILNHLPIYELEFNLSPEVWNYVRKFKVNLSEKQRPPMAEHR